MSDTGHVPGVFSSCIQVYGARTRKVCEQRCACFRGKRLAGDPQHCWRMTYAFSGRRGDCIFTDADLAHLLREIERGA